MDRILRFCPEPLPPLGCVDVKVTDALAIWPLAYPCDVPFAGTTGDTELDARLVAAFRALQPLGFEARLAWIERETFSVELVPPTVEADPYRAALCRWWLDLWEEARAA